MNVSGVFNGSLITFSQVSPRITSANTLKTSPYEGLIETLLKHGLSVDSQPQCKKFKQSISRNLLERFLAQSRPRCSFSHRVYGGKHNAIYECSDVRRCYCAGSVYASSELESLFGGNKMPSKMKTHYKARRPT